MNILYRSYHVFIFSGCMYSSVIVNFVVDIFMYDYFSPYHNDHLLFILVYACYTTVEDDIKSVKFN